MDMSTDQSKPHGHAGLKPIDAIELLRPRDFVGRHLPRKATGQAEALTLSEKCLAAAQLLLRTQILRRFSLFACRNVVERHKNPALRVARERQRMGVKSKHPLPLCRNDVIHLDRLECMTAGKDLL